MAPSGSNTSGVELEHVSDIAAAGGENILRSSIIINNQNQTQDDTIDSQLQPADHGSAAWKLLCVAFVFEAFLWGECSSNVQKKTFVAVSLIANAWLGTKGFHFLSESFKTITLISPSSRMTLMSL